MTGKKMTAKQLAKAIQRHKNVIAYHRDELSALIADAREIISDSDEATDYLEQAVAVLSRNL